LRLDKAKVNLVPTGGAIKWFKLIGVPLGNATEDYPHGDEVQTVEQWIPPDVQEGLTHEVTNAILDDIDRGLPDGNRYIDSPRAIERSAWKLVERHCPGKSEGAYRRIIKTWVDAGLLYKREYNNPVDRKKAMGFWVEKDKRPA
jgi:hypothetical protein